MAVWLKAKSRSLMQRDGKGLKAPMKKIGAEPVYFANLEAKQFEGDAEVIVVHRDDAPAEPPAEPPPETVSVHTETESESEGSSNDAVDDRGGILRRKRR